MRRYDVSKEVVEDALSNAYLSVVTYLGDVRGTPLRNPGGYAYRAAQHAVVAIMRGRELARGDLARLAEEYLAEGHSGGQVPRSLFGPSDGGDPSAQNPEVIEGEQHDGDPLRWITDELAASPGAPPNWLVSAVLSYITLVMYPEHRPASLPAPERGSTPAQATAWPALHLAGLADLLIPDAGPAVRKTRSRRIGSIRSFLDELFTAAAVRGEVTGCD
jgi:hypothetical protein